MLDLRIFGLMFIGDLNLDHFRLILFGLCIRAIHKMSY